MHCYLEWDKKLNIIFLWKFKERPKFLKLLKMPNIRAALASLYTPIWEFFMISTWTIPYLAVPILEEETHRLLTKSQPIEITIFDSIYLSLKISKSYPESRFTRFLQLKRATSWGQKILITPSKWARGYIQEIPMLGSPFAIFSEISTKISI